LNWPCPDEEIEGRDMVIGKADHFRKNKRVHSIAYRITCRVLTMPEISAINWRQVRRSWGPLHVILLFSHFS